MGVGADVGVGGGSGDGVKGALSHDAIMNEQAVDKVIVRQKAEQIAQAGTTFKHFILQFSLRLSRFLTSLC